MSIVKKVRREHDCDIRQFTKQVKEEDLGTGTLFRCDECGQVWLLIRSVADSIRLRRVDWIDRIRFRMGLYI